MGHEPSGSKLYFVFILTVFFKDMHAMSENDASKFKKRMYRYGLKSCNKNLKNFDKNPKNFPVVSWRDLAIFSH